MAYPLIVLFGSTRAHGPERRPFVRLSQRMSLKSLRTKSRNGPMIIFCACLIFAPNSTLKSFRCFGAWHLVGNWLQTIRGAFGKEEIMISSRTGRIGL